MSHVKTFCAAFAVMLVTGVFSPASAQNSPPVVVELFTSQGCYSCPPAEAYLAELAERTDIVALEFHVDYWDSLTYMWHGQWKDPFSSPQYTARQRDYNVAIRDQSGVYTPQMIIDGRIKLESGAEVARLTENSVQLEDGREIPADVVIYATGYGSMNGWVADLISQEVADKVGKVLNFPILIVMGQNDRVLFLFQALNLSFQIKGGINLHFRHCVGRCLGNGDHFIHGVFSSRLVASRR